MARLRREQREARRERGRIVDDAPGALRAMADAATARGSSEPWDVRKAFQ